MSGRRQIKDNVAQQSDAPNRGTDTRSSTSAIFLDRDGTITEEVGYVNHISRVHPFPWTSEAIHALKSTGLPVIVVTNQSGVGRGYFSEELVAQVHQMIQDELASDGTAVDAYYYCPHHPGATVQAYRQECRCRKPSTGMAEEAAQRFGINLGASYVVGDTYRDMQMGFNIGARTILLMTGYGRGEYEHHRTKWSRMPDVIAENLLAASEVILRELNAQTAAGKSLPSIGS